MPLTTDEIHQLLRLLSRKTVAKFDGYEVVREVSGYSADPKIGALQAKLSIMLASKERR